MTRLAWLPLLAAALSACVGPAGGGAGREPAEAVGPAPPGVLLLTQCSGVSTSTALMPNALSPGRPPQGWETADLETSAVGLLGLECRRVSIGFFERGPVRLVADLHTNLQPPAACTVGADEAFALHALLVDDAVLAAHLAERWQVPALPAEIAVAETDVAGARERAWTWAEPGKPASRLSFLDDGQANPAAIALRFFWPSGDGVGRLDLDLDRLQPDTSRPAHGEMREPMLMAALAGGRFAGLARAYSELSAEGALHLYEDRGCQRRVP